VFLSRFMAFFPSKVAIFSTAILREALGEAGCPALRLTSPACPIYRLPEGGGK
jgi:hypothetical protein